MSVTSATSVNSALTNIPEPAVSSSSKDQFLRLLVAQLQHQDPLTPQDGSAFIAQLAQFASLEQSAETNQRLGDLQSQQAASLHAGYSNLVGRSVSARIQEIEIPTGDGADLIAHLDAAAEKTDVAILDENGNEVSTLHLGARQEGDIPLALIDENGQPLPEGKYRIEVRATAKDGSAVAGHAEVHGLVSSVSFAGGQVRFRIGALEISPGDIVTIER